MATHARAAASAARVFTFQSREETMRGRRTRQIAIASFVCAAALAPIGIGGAGAQTGDIDEMVNAAGVAPKLELTPAQKSAIYQAVHRDTGKVAPNRFAVRIGGDVPPMIELYTLPDEVLADNPVAKLYKFTRVDDQVVLVDPTKMRVVAVIGPNPAQ
jgi:hypothetical protein